MVKNEELGFKNEELGIKNDEFCIKTDELCINNRHPINTLTGEDFAPHNNGQWIAVE